MLKTTNKFMTQDTNEVNSFSFSCVLINLFMELKIRNNIKWELPFWYPNIAPTFMPT